MTEKLKFMQKMKLLVKRVIKVANFIIKYFRFDSFKRLKQIIQKIFKRFKRFFNWLRYPVFFEYSLERFAIREAIRIDLFLTLMLRLLYIVNEVFQLEIVMSFFVFTTLNKYLFYFIMCY